MLCWQTWHWKKATKGSFKPSNYGFDPIRPRNVIANCLTEFSRVWAYNPLIDTFPHLLSIEHTTSSAVPLLLIGAAYISLQPMVRPSPAELFKRLLLGFAFILWGIVQLLPPGRTTAVLGDVVIVLYVIDLSFIIKTHLKREDWNTP